MIMGDFISCTDCLITTDGVAGCIGFIDRLYDIALCKLKFFIDLAIVDSSSDSDAAFK